MRLSTRRPLFVQGWGGPTPPDVWDRARDFAVTQLAAMRAFGMTPVLPGFAGHVPSALPRIFPNASYTDSSDWCVPHAFTAGCPIPPPPPPHTHTHCFHHHLLRDAGAASRRLTVLTSSWSRPIPCTSPLARNTMPRYSLRLEIPQGTKTLSSIRTSSMRWRSGSEMLAPSLSSNLSPSPTLLCRDDEMKRRGPQSCCCLLVDMLLSAA
jgi:hypothetical protein